MWAAKICPTWPISMMTDETMKRTKQNYIEKGWERTSSSATLSFLNIAAVAILKLPFWSYPHPIRGPTFHPAEELIPPLQWCHPTCLPWRTSLQNVQPGQMAWWCPAKRSKKHHGQRQTSNKGGISTGTTRRSSDRKSKYWCLFSQFSNILR